MERPRITWRFVTGVATIIISFVIAKLTLIPLIMFPDSSAWRLGMITLYIITWIMLLVGVYIAGKESYSFVKYKYEEYSRETIYHVKRHSTMAANKLIRRRRTTKLKL